MTQKPIVNNYIQGLRDGLPICLGYISVAFTFGMIAVSGGFAVWQAVLISMMNVTSAGQFAGMDLMKAGAGLFEMGLTQLVINLRYALMSVSVSQKLDSSVSLLDRLLFSFCNTDEVFAVCSQKSGDLGRRYLYGVITAPYFGWAFGTLLGALIGTVLPQILKDCLGIAIYGMFIAIIVPPAKKYRPVAIVTAVAIVLSCAFCYLPLFNRVSSGFVIILCAVVSSVLGAWLFPLHQVDESQTAQTQHA